MRGIIKDVFVEKQFGFVRGSDAQDYFFHATGVLAPDLIDRFTRGDAVEFVPDPNGPRGPRATDLRHLTETD